MNLFRYINKKINDLILKKFENDITKDKSLWCNFNNKDFISLCILLIIFALTVFTCFNTPFFLPVSDRSLNSEEQQALKQYQVDSSNFINSSINNIHDFIHIDKIGVVSFNKSSKYARNSIENAIRNIEIFKPERPIRKCRWYEPENGGEFIGFILLIVLELLVLTFFISLIFSKKNMGVDLDLGWVWSISYMINAGLVCYGSLFVCYGSLMYLINYGTGIIWMFFWILYLLYIFLTLFLLNWSGKSVKYALDLDGVPSQEE